MDTSKAVRINSNIALIDFESMGVRRAGAVYLVRAGKSCLIDAGTRTEARVIVKALEAMDAFPPDVIVLTHAHFDHTQGVPVLRQEARKRGREIAVLASEKAIPHLSDGSWNTIFEQKVDFQNITGVTPLVDGQTIDLDGLVLHVLDVAGHCADDIALYEPGSRTLFVGDALGMRIERTVTIPPFMPPFWDPDGFKAAVDRLAQVDYQRICLTHFGCLEGDEARRFVERAVPTCEQWWDLFRQVDREDKLDDIGHLLRVLIEQLGLVLPDLELSKGSMRLIFALVNLARRVVGRQPLRVAEIQMETVLGWLALEYRTYTAQT